MNQINYFSKSFIGAAGAFIYIFAVAALLSNGEKIFGQAEKETFLIPVFMLLLFVVSAAVTGLLVLGKPIQLYLDGQKQEGVKLLLHTLAWLALFLIVVGGIIIAIW